MRFHFGKWEGRDLDDPEVPTSYIRSLVNVAHREEYEAELERRKQAATGETEIIKQIISRGFASLYHDARTGQGTDEEKAAQMRMAEGAVAALGVMLRKYCNDYGPPNAIRRRKRVYALKMLEDKFISDEDREWALAELAEEPE